MERWIYLQVFLDEVQHHVHRNDSFHPSTCEQLPSILPNKSHIHIRHENRLPFLNPKISRVPDLGQGKNE
jgi:hypothetical protein